MIYIDKNKKHRSGIYVLFTIYTNNLDKIILFTEKNNQNFIYLAI